MANEKVDILKIQKTIRKAIKDYTITAKYGEEVLISIISVDLYLQLTEEAPVTPKPPKRPIHPEVIPCVQTAECN